MNGTGKGAYQFEVSGKTQAYESLGSSLDTQYMFAAKGQMVPIKGALYSNSQ